MSLCALLLGVCGASAQAGELPFAPAADVYASANFATSVFAGDVDGDGDVDLLSASALDQRIRWHENLDGVGGSWMAHDIDVAAAFARSVSAADIDGDGHLDVLSASNNDDEVRVYRNLVGDGSVWTPVLVSGNALGAQSVSSADVDGDGDLDVLSASSADKKIAWHENTAGDGSAWLEHPVPVVADFARSVSSADVDGDGDVDLLSASRLDNKIAWYENSAGDGSLWTTHTIPAGALGPESVFAADVDGDGDVDVLSASSVDDRVAWYDNLLGDGSSWSVNTIDPNAPGAVSVFALDFDMDGDVDVLSALSGDGRIRWYENLDAVGGSWLGRDAGVGASGAQAVHAADVDGDGDADALSASANDDRIAWYPNLSLHRSADPALESPIDVAAGDARSILEADVDGDGSIDVLAAANGTGALTWYRNSAGDGSAWSATTLATGAPGSDSVAAADFDRDGDLDVVAASVAGNRVDWYRNDAGDGSAWTTGELSSVQNGAISVMVSDVNRNGVPDVIVAAAFSGSVSWFEKTGPDPNAWTQSPIASGMLFPTDAEPGDLDGDGDVDVVTATFGGLLWHRQEPGLAWTSFPIPGGPSSATSATPADLDGDGDLDVLSSSFSDGSVRWHENLNGDGVTWVEHTMLGSIAGAISVFALDLDADGDLDVLVAAETAGRVERLENSAGDGSIWTATTLASLAGATSVRASDLDADGDPDVLASFAAVQRLSWYPNTGGQAAFSTLDLAPPAALQGTSHALLSLDLSHRGRAGDADLELATLSLLLESKQGFALDDPQADAIFAAFELYGDEGSGSFEAGADPLLWVQSSLSLNAGVLTLTLPDGDPNLAVAVGATKRFFLVVDLETDASQQDPHRFRVSHRTASSGVEDRDHDLLLALETPLEVATRRVVIANPGSDDDGDGVLDLNETDTGVFVSPTDTGTSPIDPDSDGDVYPDGLEIANGTDPTDPNDFPPFQIPVAGALPPSAPALALLGLLLAVWLSDRGRARRS